MHRVALSYTLDAASVATDTSQCVVQHPLPALLAAVHDTGSISGAARRMRLSYRHVWGELKRWEAEFGQPLVTWVRGQPARLAPAGERLLRAERLAQARLAPQLDAVCHTIAQAFHGAFDAPLPALTVCAGHEPLLLRLRHMARSGHGLDLQITHGSGIAALAALRDGRSELAWLHTVAGATAQSPTAQGLRPWLQPATQRLVGVATRTIGLLVAPGNPRKIVALADLARDGLRFVGREPGSGTRLALDELLLAQRIDPVTFHANAATEPTQQAVAEAVACASADAGLGDDTLAHARGLGFVPLAQEHCCLVVPRDRLTHAPVVALLELLRSPAWRHDADAAAHMRPMRNGEVQTLSRRLPWWGAGARDTGDHEVQR